MLETDFLPVVASPPATSTARRADPATAVARTASDSSDRQPHDLLDADVARELARLLSGLRFGSVEIVVHDGAITQMERREKLRMTGVPPRRV